MERFTACTFIIIIIIKKTNLDRGKVINLIDKADKRNTIIRE